MNIFLDSNMMYKVQDTKSILIQSNNPRGTVLKAIFSGVYRTANCINTEMITEPIKNLLVLILILKFFARYVSINSFTETVIKTTDRDEIIRWPAQIGRRQII